MKKSGKINSVEPVDTSWAEKFPDCVAIFERDGWFEFIWKIDGFNMKLSYRFSHGLDKNTVAIETLNFELTRDLIEEATGIATAR